MQTEVEIKKIQTLFIDPDDYETEEEAKAAYFFPTTTQGRKMLREAEKSKSLTYLEFKTSMNLFVASLINNEKYRD